MPAASPALSEPPALSLVTRQVDEPKLGKAPNTGEVKAAVFGALLQVRFVRMPLERAMPPGGDAGADSKAVHFRVTAQK